MATCTFFCTLTLSFRTLNAVKGTPILAMVSVPEYAVFAGIQVDAVNIVIILAVNLAFEPMCGNAITFSPHMEI